MPIYLSCYCVCFSEAVLLMLASKPNIRILGYAKQNSMTVGLEFKRVNSSLLVKSVT